MTSVLWLGGKGRYCWRDCPLPHPTPAGLGKQTDGGNTHDTVMVSLQHNQQSSKTDVPSAVWTRARDTVSGVVLPTHSPKKRSREALLMISRGWGHPMTRLRVDCSLRKVKADELGSRATETPGYTWCQMPG